MTGRSWPSAFPRSAASKSCRFGYLRHLGEMTRIAVDYQFKNRPSFNDDAANGRFHITWSVEF